MKRITIFAFLIILSLIVTACGERTSNEPSAQSSANQMQQEQSGESSNLPNESPQASNEEEKSPAVLTDFTVEIYPAVGSTEPVDSPPITFTLEIPGSWVAEENTSAQYIYHEEKDSEFPIAIIQGDRKVSNPQKPFEDVYEEFPTTVSIAEVDVSSYPVLRHIIKDDSGDTPFYAYSYYILVEDSLVSIELRAFDNTPQTQEKCDAIVSSFTVK
ncbi:hypothetical protein U6B65_05460 [Oscillospiraceae bacterium MB08-C2-2]|nr:hypothetical protein U6B65_05460 [Oscillospiraceae bacterium MB08-C2-2]